MAPIRWPIRARIECIQCTLYPYCELIFKCQKCQKRPEAYSRTGFRTDASFGPVSEASEECDDTPATCSDARPAGQNNADSRRNMSSAACVTQRCPIAVRASYGLDTTPSASFRTTSLVV
jgi:hypothetical protein